MAWGFRRSMKVAGPLRLNFSKSGLGLSLGVKGLHVGVSPKRGPYLRAGVPGTGIYYRSSLGQRRPAPVAPSPVMTSPPTHTQRETPWFFAVQALLGNEPERCVQILDRGVLGSGPALHVELGRDVVVTLLPDACGVAVLRAEALERLGRKHDAISTLEAAVAASGCTVAKVALDELNDTSSRE
jgi:hypothetical protein